MLCIKSFWSRKWRWLWTLESMETPLDQANNRISYTQTNPLFDMSLSRSDLYSFQPEGECYSRVLLILSNIQFTSLRTKCFHLLHHLVPDVWITGCSCDDTEAWIIIFSSLYECFCLNWKKKNMMASAFDKISSLIIKPSLSRQSFRLVICLRSLCLFLPLELQLLYVGRALANHSLSQLSDILTVTNCLSVFI